MHFVFEGTIDGHLKYNPNLAVLYVDCHMDVNTNLTSRTGNIHGMPVALLAKEMRNLWNQLPETEWSPSK